MIEFLKNLKLSISQWTILFLVSVVGILGVVLRWKEKEIDMLKLTYLQEHFTIENEKMNSKIQASSKKLQKSKERLQDELSAFNNKHNDYDYTALPPDEPKS